MTLVMSSGVGLLNRIKARQLRIDRYADNAIWYKILQAFGIMQE